MYYPKSKILLNQFTSGKEYAVKRTNLSYIGYYYLLSKNKAYTGKTPDSSNTEELILISTLKNINQYDVINKGLTIKTNNDSLPNPFFPSPTDNDYNQGFVTRYFIKKRNENYTTIREISPSDFDNFDDSESVYVTTKLNWKISGLNIEETNKRLVGFKEGIFPGFTLWFKDFKHFSK